MKTHCLIIGFAILFSGCGPEIARVTTGGATACQGAIDTTPRALATGLGAGKLYVAGEHLVHVETELGRVLRVDRCSGETEVVAQLEKVTSSAVDGEQVYMTGTSNGLAGVYRVPVDGGTLELVTDVPVGAMVAHDSRVFALKQVGPDTQNVNILSLDKVTGAFSVLREIKLFAPMASVSLIGASDAGIYLVESYDCGCNPGLELATFDGQSYAAVPGTAGARSLAAVDGNLYVAAEVDSIGFGSSLLDVVRLPLEGGEPEILLAADEAHTNNVRVVAANERTVCWAGYAAAPRCLGLDAGSQVRVVGVEGEREGAEPIVMTNDAVYWLRVDKGGTGFDLMGAAP